MTIFNQAQKLQFSMALPLKESIMFLEGTPYQTGSDYPDDFLSMSVGEIQSGLIEDEERDYGEELEPDQDYREYQNNEISSLNSK